MRGEDVRFAVNSMAGRLATWLRILGFDTIYVRSGKSRQIVDIAKQERRTILTRKTGLGGTPREVVILRSERLSEQLQQVVEELGLRDKIRFFTRCSVCNTLLQPKSREEAKGKVPFFVHQTQKRFGYCPKCEKFYWEGTHHQEMLEEMEKLGY